MSTFTNHQRFAERNPAKARKYALSIAASLAGDRIHEIERARLEQAAAGIASVLDPATTCRRCGRVIEAKDSVAIGLGSHCARMAEAS